MKYNNNAGHGKQDSKSCGAVKIVKESVENRLLAQEVERLLKLYNHTVYNCTVDYPNSQQDCLDKIIALCNKNKVDLNISHHLNSGRNDSNGDGSIGGVEVWVYSKNSASYEIALRICKELEKSGFKNRGVKIDPKLQFLKRTKDESLLIEYFFVDDKDDCNLYNRLGYKALAKAVVQGILNKTINDSAGSNNSNSQGVSFKDGGYTGRRAKVIANELNVRYTRWIGNISDPKKIGVLKQGQIVSLEWCEYGWVSIQGFNGEKGLGYVNSEFLQLL